MALNFPNTPTLDQVYTDGQSTWKWNGFAWEIIAGVVNRGDLPVPVDISDLTDTTNLIPDSILDLGISDGTADQVLTTDGAGNFTFTTVTDGGGGGGGSGEANQNAFSNIAVTGQNTIEADSTTDTLNIVGGAGISVTTNDLTDTIVIQSTVTAGVDNFTELTDITTAGLNAALVYEPAIAMLRVDNVGLTAYTFNSHYSGENPTIYAISGTTLAFDLSQISGHPFELQDGTSAALTEGLVHVDTDGTVSTNAAAQGKTSGVLYWRIDRNISGGYRYQCTAHANMVGAITVKGIAVI
jgi:plastocyanin